MNLDLTDKIVLITGSTKGLGLDLAKHFLSEGAIVILNGRNRLKLDATMESLSMEYKNRVNKVLGDVTCCDDVKTICDFVNNTYGYLDILVTNVGSGSSPKAGDETLFDWQDSISINLYSAVNMIKYGSELLKKSPHDNKAIVCISSICGHEDLGAPLAYSASKAALNHYVKVISKYLANFNIRINAVSPGNLLFPGSSWEHKITDNKDQVYKYINEQVSLKRFGSPNEIAPTVCFLASTKSSFTTGTVIVVDGGQLRS